MNEQTVDSPSPASQRYLPWLLFLFIGSGCAALIYEIVWLQPLQLVTGVSPVSLGVLLGTFMGGMCLGSLVLPRYISRRHHPLRVYAFLELGIGVFGLLILFGMPLVTLIYTTWGGSTFSLFLRCLVASLCLLPPTLLMGATLPALADLIAAATAVVALAPFAVMVMYYFFIDPENTERLFVTVPGQLILCTSLVFNLVAYLWARKILNADI